jgi:hypothetical protein
MEKILITTDNIGLIFECFTSELKNLEINNEKIVKIVTTKSIIFNESIDINAINNAFKLDEPSIEMFVRKYYHNNFDNFVSKIYPESIAVQEPIVSFHQTSTTSNAVQFGY